MNIGEREKSGKNCLVFFRNKKICDYDGISEITAGCASRGYYFNKVLCVAYDDSWEITFALSDTLKNYENIVIYCPKAMENTIKGFITAERGGEFSELNIYAAQDLTAFMLFSDCTNRLLIEDICAVLNKKYSANYERAYIKTIGAPNLLINDAISQIKSACADISVNATEKYGDCVIELVYNVNIPKTEFDKAMRAGVSVLNGYIYSLDENTLAEKLVQLLKLRRLKISVAESFTGGGIAKKLVDISGVSEVYVEGLNTYANESKIKRLGVNTETLRRYGAVSGQTAAEMAEGLLATGLCGVAVSTTGIAGPKSDNTKKPVGLVYIGVATADGTSVYEFNLKGSRNDITQTGINFALFAAFKKIK
ncbi:MAG: nicotinamide-nucleotide amidohydrolase family protein [Clostridia bacterium]|nr:nicotinamide-nucleotide amidohydrolase family protein [Clostridia bacterium]